MRALITFPDLPGCMADGETEAEAVENGRDAFLAVVSALADMGRDIPGVENGRRSLVTCGFPS